jgi:hypothetical protein
MTRMTMIPSLTCSFSGPIYVDMVRSQVSSPFRRCSSAVGELDLGATGRPRLLASSRAARSAQPSGGKGLSRHRRDCALSPPKQAPQPLLSLRSRDHQGERPLPNWDPAPLRRPTATHLHLVAYPHRQAASPGSLGARGQRLGGQRASPLASPGDGVPRQDASSGAPNRHASGITQSESADAPRLPETSCNPLLPQVDPQRQ